MFYYIRAILPRLSIKERKCLINTYANLGDRADLLDSITALEKELAAKTDKDIVLVLFSI